MQAFYRKWRPRRWEDVVGQEHVVQTLHNAVASGRFAHAQLLAGPRGTGKTTVARLVAKAVNCLDENPTARPCDQCEHCRAVNQGRFLDLIEIDAASNTSVEDVRELRDKINFTPNQGRYKVYIVDEVHMLSTAAFNALLKTLEEPPPHAIFILATTEVHKIPATVLSRCQRHEFRRIPVADIVAFLKKIAESEGITVEPAVLTLIARQATGAMRDAISLLDQLASAGKSISLEVAQAVLGTATSAAVLELFDALAAGDAACGLNVIQRTLDAGVDPRQFARQIVEYLRGLLMIAIKSQEQVDASSETRVQMARHAQVFGGADLRRFIRAFNQSASEIRGSWLPALPLEMAYLEALEPQPPPQSQAQLRTPQRSQPDLNEPVVRPSQPKSQAGQQMKDTTAAPERAPAVMGPEEGSSSSLQLEENWQTILALTRQHNPNTYGVLNSCRARRLKDDILTLGFASDVIRSKMEKSENLEVVISVLKQVFKRDIIVRCVTLTGKRSTPPPGVDSDGMVASALRDLGGEIVDIHK